MKELLGLVRRAVGEKMGQLHLGAVGRVVAYDSEKQRATLRLVCRDDADRELPQLHNVPVLFPRASARVYIGFDLEPGDEVWVMHSDRSLDDYLDGGQDLAMTDTVRPADNRRFDLSDAVCYPGIVPWTKAFPSPGGNLVLEPGEGVVKLGVGAGDFVALAALVLAELDDIRSKHDNHTHPVPALGTSSTPTAPMGPAGSVAAIRTMAE